MPRLTSSSTPIDYPFCCKHSNQAPITLFKSHQPYINQKIDKYRDLRIEIAKMWQLWWTNIKIVLVVIGTLGSIPPKLRKHLETLERLYKLDVLQKSALLGTAWMLCKVWSVCEVLVATWPTVLKVPNWRAPELDGMKFTGSSGLDQHKKWIALLLDNCLQNNLVPEWMVERKTDCL